MIPRTVSASSLESAAGCLARYRAMSMDRASGFQNDAAKLGTTLHAALEKFTDPGLMRAGVWDWDMLEACFNFAYQEIFGHDTHSEWFQQGLDILKKWYNRHDQQSDIQEVHIISREIKKSFPIPYWVNGQKHEVPCNYIIDRLDMIGEKKFRVVDYKSQRSPLSPEDMYSKVQPKIYALAVQIEYPDAEEIWVQYDFLRYDRVAIRFTKQDNANTWRWLKGAVQRIVDAPDNPPETLNENCRYCVRKFVCKTMQNNIRSGGIFSLTIDELALLYHDTKSQADALLSMRDEIGLQLLRYADEEGLLEWETPEARLKVTAYKKRVIDRDKMAQILGPDLMRDYGRLNVGDLDELRKDPRLTSEQASLLNTAIETKYSDPTIKVTKK